MKRWQGGDCKKSPTKKLKFCLNLVQDNLACVRVSEDPRNPRHQLDPTPGKSGSIVQRVVEDKHEEDVELLVEGPAQGGHLDAIDGTIALTI